MSEWDQSGLCLSDDLDQVIFGHLGPVIPNFTRPKF